jgi:hypothetical protein
MTVDRSGAKSQPCRDGKHADLRFFGQSQSLSQDASFGLDEFDEFGFLAADEVADTVAEKSQRTFEFRKSGHSLLNGGHITSQNNR